MNTRRTLALLAAALVAPLSAEQFGLFTYEVGGETVEITNYPTTETGAVVIPAEIRGNPVTSIGGHFDSSPHPLHLRRVSVSAHERAFMKVGVTPR